MDPGGVAGEDDGEEGGDGEPDEAAEEDRLAKLLSQGIMVCDSTYMVPPNVVLPVWPQELQDWQRQRRLGWRPRAYPTAPWVVAHMAVGRPRRR